MLGQTRILVTRGAAAVCMMARRIAATDDGPSSVHRARSSGFETKVCVANHEGRESPK